jgi:hypothetical protein
MMCEAVCGAYTGLSRGFCRAWVEKCEDMVPTRKDTCDSRYRSSIASYSDTIMRRT